jgi:hypothetical protein
MYHGESISTDRPRKTACEIDLLANEAVVDL